VTARGTPARRAARTARRDPSPRDPAAPGARLAAPPPGLRLILGAIALVLVAAPPASNYFWAVNALRSLPAAWGVALLAASAGAGLMALAPAAPGARRVVAALIAGLVAIGVAFPLRESIHFLGDTQLRLRSLTAFVEGAVTSPFTEWVGRLHANPLDLAVNLLLPMELMRTGLPLRDGISAVSAALALLYFFGLWRMARRLGAPADLRVPLALAMGLSGTLEAFAGYAESAGLLAALTVWWCAEAFSPQNRPASAVRLALAWVAVLLAHRLGAVLLLPMLWRAIGPAWAEDRPESRRQLLHLTLATVAIGAIVLLATPAGRQIGADLNEMLVTLRVRGFRSVAPTDLANTLMLVAPLALIAPFIAGRAAAAAFVRRPEFALAMTLAVPLFLAMVFLFPVGGSGLGAQRDWDSNVILGLALTAAAAALLARLPAAAVRARLAWALPVLALASLGFVAVQVPEPVAERRAVAVAGNPPALPESQASHAILYLGQRAMDHGRFAEGARYYERAFELNPNPRRALLAAEAWAASGDPVAARRALERARARGFDPGLAEAARQIEALLAPPAPAPDSAPPPR